MTYLPNGGTIFERGSDKSTLDFDNASVNIKSNMEDITSDSPCSCVAIGIGVFLQNIGIDIVLKKGKTSDSSFFILLI